MATMPELVGFSLDYAIIQLIPLGVSPSISYQEIAPPQQTVGIVMAQSPSSGSTLSGSAALVVSGGIKLPGVGVTVFSQPAILIGNDDNP